MLALEMVLFNGAPLTAASGGAAKSISMHRAIICLGLNRSLDLPWCPVSYFSLTYALRNEHSSSQWSSLYQPQDHYEKKDAQY
jgi:hypothetical protein